MWKKIVLNNFFPPADVLLHAVSRTQQVTQRESTVNTLRSLLSTDFFDTLRGEWLNSMLGFCFGVRAEKGKLIFNKKNRFHPIN